MDRDELGSWLRLATTPGVGNLAARKLLAAFEWPATIFTQSEASLTGCVTPRQAKALLAPPPQWQTLLETTWHWLHATDTPEGTARDIVTLGDPRYPRLLLDTEDPPLMLYVVGSPERVNGLPFCEGRCLAVVGSRNPTAQGADHAYEFSKALHGAGLTIVSGLALGVDGAAHEGALAACNPDAAPDEPAATIAVVGTGLDRVYPSKHLALAHRIARHGLLVSEYPLGTPPLAANFPKRNRIISGLSQGTLVVEAALASGSLITARMAVEQGREVFAIPGSIHAPQSRGCHALIKQGAKLVESAQDVLEECRWAVSTGQGSASPAAQGNDGAHSRNNEATGTASAPGEPEDHPLLKAMGYDPVGLDTLVERTGMDTASLQVQLLELELDGAIARLPGSLFQRMGRS